MLLESSSCDVPTVAVATEVFRNAPNGHAAVAFLTERLGFPVTIASKGKEALLGYECGRILSPFRCDDDDDAVVWDCGAASFQVASTNAYHSDCHGSGSMHQMALQAQGSHSNTKLVDILLRSLSENLKPLPTCLSTPRPFPVIAIGSSHSIFNQLRLLTPATLARNEKPGFCFNQDDVVKTIREFSALSHPEDMLLLERERSAALGVSAGLGLTNLPYVIPKLALLLGVLRKTAWETVEYYHTDSGNCAALLVASDLWGTKADLPGPKSHVPRGG
jgi:exopolyphosphatase/pppGpp-phosphohydrolase